MIVESPAKAKTINKYLGSGYVVEASVGHVRDLPKRNPKGVDAPVPGIDLENDFQPQYVPIDGKKKTIQELRKVARKSDDIWLATDLDREGEAIAWHLAEELGVPHDRLKRVVFNAVTQQAIERAFENPRAIDMDMVNAQQARRILDRIVGYQVSPLLWKKVAGGLSAGRVQSVTVMLVVEREYLIRAHVPDESWEVTVRLALDPEQAGDLGDRWSEFLQQLDEKGKPPTKKKCNAWLDQEGALQTTLVEVGGEPLKIGCPGDAPVDLSAEITRAVEATGLLDVDVVTEIDEEGKGPARERKMVTGRLDPAARYRVKSVTTKSSPKAPPPPFKTSTLQRAASTRLGFTADRTMRAAQGLYQGVALGGGDQVGLITYMRTDSTHLAEEAVGAVREYIEKEHGQEFRPEQSRVYETTNPDAQEAHEAIRPTDVARTPESLKSRLGDDQWKLYDLVWRRFVACQMADALWDATIVLLERSDRNTGAVLKVSGRVQVFAGYQSVAGVPESDDQVLPVLAEKDETVPFDIQPLQKFSPPPSRYNEASLIKKLEEEGIGRPSTYASILKVIQDRRYVEKRGSTALYPTDLGEVVTEKLREGFPGIMDVGYTKWMEEQLDAVEEGSVDWVDFLHTFYSPFSESLSVAHEVMTHAKAETELAPKEYSCPECGKPTEYRFGRNGKFLSCTGFNVEAKPSGINCPECKPKVELGVFRGKTARARPFLTCAECQFKWTWRKLDSKQKEIVAGIAETIREPCRYAAPIDHEGRPIEPQQTNVACLKCNEAMIMRTGRFGPFLSCVKYPECDGVVNIDKKTGCVKLPKPPPLLTDLLCPKCDEPLNLRNGKRGPWLGCSKFPRCRGRQAWTKLEDEVKDNWSSLLESHEKENRPPDVMTVDGEKVEEGFRPVSTDEEEVAEPAGAADG